MNGESVFAFVTKGRPSVGAPNCWEDATGRRPSQTLFIRFTVQRAKVVIGNAFSSFSWS